MIPELLYQTPGTPPPTIPGLEGCSSLSLRWKRESFPTQGRRVLWLGVFTCL